LKKIVRSEKATQMKKKTESVAEQNGFRLFEESKATQMKK
jgi:hypothetical protein